MSSDIEKELRKVESILGKDKKEAPGETKLPREKVSAIFIRKNGLIEDKVTAERMGRSIHYKGMTWLIKKDNEDRSQFLRLMKFGFFKRILPVPTYVLIEGEPYVFMLGQRKYALKTSDGTVYLDRILDENDIGLIVTMAENVGKLQALRQLAYIERLALFALLAGAASAGISIYVLMNVNKIMELLEKLIGKIL